MKKNYTINIIDEIVTTRFSKKPNLTEAKNALDEVLEMGNFRLRLWVLEDGINLCNEEIEEIARYGKEKWPVPSKAAIVASDDLSFGIMRVHDVYREHEGHQIHVFRTEPEALAWLKEKLEM